MDGNTPASSVIGTNALRVARNLPFLLETVTKVGEHARRRHAG
jgi:hypothetical protein